MRCASEEDTTKIFLHRTGGEDAGAARTLRRSTERRPLRMHSLSPVPSTMTSYSMSMAAVIGSPGGRRAIGGEREREREGSRKLWISNGSTAQEEGRSGRKGDDGSCSCFFNYTVQLKCSQRMLVHPYINIRTRILSSIS